MIDFVYGVLVGIIMAEATLVFVLATARQVEE